MDFLNLQSYLHGLIVNGSFADLSCNGNFGRVYRLLDFNVGVCGYHLIDG
ncbi:940_t:CDS:2 [Ambispora leptoticha]|uniref:940_t:CDS:1 n=1 Tax=Ambispora leptoticha TaxID=144679 RepID=A0A9N8VM70_9GLOM|nr:940_t:CDS:2 [Ambispora leptoticha]